MDVGGFFMLLFGDKWYAQWLGVVAIILSFVGYQNKASKRIFLFQILTSFLWSVSLFLVGAYTGMVLNVLGLVRSMFLYRNDTRWGRSRVSMWAMTVLMVAGGVFSWQGWFSILPTIAMAAGTPLLWTRRDKTVRAAQLGFISPLWLVHNYFAGSVAGVITELLNMISVVITMIRVRKNAAEKE